MLGSQEFLVIAIMIVLTAEVTKKLGLTKIGSVLMSFIIAIGLFKVFQLNTIQSDIITDGVPGVL